jgi:hypothetical protein
MAPADMSRAPPASWVFTRSHRRTTRPNHLQRLTSASYTFETPHKSAHVFAAATWKLGRPRRYINYLEIENCMEEEMLPPEVRLVDGRTLFLNMPFVRTPSVE